MNVWVLNFLGLLFLNFCFAVVGSVCKSIKVSKKETGLTLEVMCVFYELNALPGKYIPSLALT